MCPRYMPVVWGSQSGLGSSGSPCLLLLSVQGFHWASPSFLGLFHAAHCPVLLVDTAGFLSIPLFLPFTPTLESVYTPTYILWGEPAKTRTDHSLGQE